MLLGYKDNSAKTNRTALFKIVKQETFEAKAPPCMSLGSTAIIVCLRQKHCMGRKKDNVTMNKTLTKGNQGEPGGLGDERNSEKTCLSTDTRPKAR